MGCHGVNTPVAIHWEVPLKERVKKLIKFKCAQFARKKEFKSTVDCGPWKVVTYCLDVKAGGQTDCCGRGCDGMALVAGLNKP